MKNINTLLLAIFCFLISCTSAFAITTVVTLPLILTVGIIFLLVIQINLNKLKTSFSYLDLFLFLFLFFSFCTSLYNNFTWYSSKSINHSIVYFYVIVGTYFLLKLAFLNLQYSKKVIYTSIVLSVFTASCFGCVEFVLKGFYDIKLDELIPRADVIKYNPMALGELVRIRSFMEESGHFAFYLELLFPICILIIRNKLSSSILGFKFSILFTLTSLTAFILTFSSAGIAIVLLAYFIIVFPQKFWNILKNIIFNRVKRLYFFLTLFSLLFLVIVLFSNIIVVYDIFDQIVFGKLSEGSADDRQDRIVAALKLFDNSNIIYKLIGYGPGAYDKLKIESIVSLYFTYLLEVGFIGLFIFILFTFFLFQKVFYAFEGMNRKLFLFSIFCAIVHFLFISNYWYPWFWFVIILIDVIKRDLKEVAYFKK